MTDASQIEQRTELVKARGIEVGTTLGGIQIQTVADLEQISLRLARGLVAVPVHCRDQPGVVYALCMQALEWGMPIMSVINKSYVPRNGDRIGFESQLLHAVIEKNAPIKGRLRYEITGEGDERRCKVFATFKGEDKPHEYVSETLGKMHPGHSEKDGKKFVRGSQLWDTNPEVQMFYSASRQWARLFCPDVLLGAYTPEEMENAVPMLDVTPSVAGLAQRLRDAKTATAQGLDRGFDHDHVVREAAQRNTIIEGEANSGDAKEEVSDGDAERSGNEPDDEGRRDQAGDRADDDQHPAGGAGTDSGDPQDVTVPAGKGSGAAKNKESAKRTASPKPKR